MQSLCGSGPIESDRDPRSNTAMGLRQIVPMYPGEPVPDVEGNSRPSHHSDAG